ncbi:MAG: DUF1150 family protein [Alphaproteobacteria bacterium]|nr:DUF1150 family protein [Alphaproteobacteria bacterium]
MNKHDAVTSTPRNPLEPHAFLALGTPSLAFIRPVTVNGMAGFGIFAADGTGIGAAPSRDLAFSTARQHDLEPVSVH